MGSFPETHNDPNRPPQGLERGFLVPNFRSFFTRIPHPELLSSRYREYRFHS